MNELRQVIGKYNASKEESVLEDFKFIHNGKSGYGESLDLNYGKRKDLILELYEDYSADDKTLIKWLLIEELKASQIDSPVYTVDLCAFMLYKHMEIEDIYELYEAKFGAYTDLQVYVDMELVFGFDKEETKAYLNNKQKDKRKNKKILKAIYCYEQNPDAQFRSRAEYIEHFETRKIKGIKADLEEMNEN
ncbi:hypothetical protein [Pedobacter caeni]|uniref:Uncharacterized protein n=1 Tax=Pedobacter caeni TaxID=288992 RepID=A0A1M5KUV4_9SPHI|nr:hypothetical protein [Pedobacter caeni]SHG55943.1 hypothetical protein SAMN04488522_10681 [Pedobacter caeni]